MEKPVSIAGFYFPGKNPNKEEENNEKSEIENLSSEIEANLEVKEDSGKNDENNNNSETNENCENEDNDSDEENDEEGWITPGNLDQVKKASLNDVEQFDIKEQKFQVGCMTSDFSMQNVLIQIGIPVLSVDGLLIKRPRSYAQRCITCMK